MLKLLETQGPVQVCSGKALPLPLLFLRFNFVVVYITRIVPVLLHYVCSLFDCSAIRITSGLYRISVKNIMAESHRSNCGCPTKPSVSIFRVPANVRTWHLWNTNRHRTSVTLCGTLWYLNSPASHLAHKRNPAPTGRNIALKRGTWNIWDCQHRLSYCIATQWSKKMHVSVT